MFADAVVEPRIDVASPGGAWVNVSCSVIGPDGVSVLGQSSAEAQLGPGGWARVTPPPISLSAAALWFPAQTPASGDRPLYTLVTLLTTAGGAVADVANVTFGIREAVFNATSGLWVNGFPVKIRGMSVHQDFGPTGTFVPPNLHAFRVQVGGSARGDQVEPPPPPVFFFAASPRPWRQCVAHGAQPRRSDAPCRDGPARRNRVVRDALPPHVGELRAGCPGQ
jgi:hypothetical protein